MANAYLIQSEPQGDKCATFAHVRKTFLRARPEPGSLVVFPEMFATGFLTHPDESLAETLDEESSPTIEFLQSLADETRCLVLGGGIEKFAHGDFRFRNWTGIFSPGHSQPEKIYRKRHPFADEQALFSPGTSAVLFGWKDFTVSPFVCFDLRFPEDFREMRRQGANLFCIQAEWPRAREMHFQTLLRARAIENQCYVLACGRAGKDFANSYAFGPNGEEILKGDPEEGAFSVSLDVEAVVTARRNFPLPEFRA